MENNLSVASNETNSSPDVASAHDINESIKNRPQLIKQFIDAVAKSYSKLISESDALRFLIARKYDYARALALYARHENVRREEDLVDFRIDSEPVQSELNSGKFTIVPNVNIKGPALAVFKARLHYPLVVPLKFTLQSLIFQLDTALRSPNTQLHGLIVIYDMTDIKYANFDYDLSQKILTLLEGAYPAKLKKVFIVSAPFWFKASFSVLSLFLNEKIHKRIVTVTSDQLFNHLPVNQIPKEYRKSDSEGRTGQLSHNHSQWIRFCYDSFKNPQLIDYLEYCSGGSGSGGGGGAVAVNNSSGTGLNDLKLCDSVPTSSSSSSRSSSLSTSADTIINRQETSKKLAATGTVGMGVMANVTAPCNSTNNSSSIGKTAIAYGTSANIDRAADTNCCNYDSDSPSDDLSCEEFVQSIFSKLRYQLVQEYMQMRAKSDKSGSFSISSAKCNISKNRYSDVLCLDHSRVPLACKSADNDSDYIHANFVNGYKQKNAFILTQGPMQNTAEDFWQMVWEQNSVIIVMLTKLIERGRTKCHKYWEPDVGAEVLYGNIRIKTLETNVFDNYIQTKLQITNLKTDEIRELAHWQFIAWPDYGVPKSAKSVLDFLQHVREDQVRLLPNSIDTRWPCEPEGGPPVIVHCSAGIGRTGTYCTIDICISKLLNTNKINVQSIVEKIRAQRAYSIQMPDQYIFCHLAIVEFAVSIGLLEPTNLSYFYELFEDYE